MRGGKGRKKKRGREEGYGRDGERVRENERERERDEAFRHISHSKTNFALHRCITFAIFFANRWKVAIEARTSMTRK